MGFNQEPFCIELSERANREEVFSTRRGEGIHHILLLKDKGPFFSFVLNLEKVQQIETSALPINKRERDAHLVCDSFDLNHHELYENTGAALSVATMPDWVSQRITFHQAAGDDTL